MDVIFELLFSFLFLYSIYQLASLAGVFSEKSGVVNIAIEGNMLLTAALFAVYWIALPETIQNIPELRLFISIFLAILSGMVYVLLLSYFTNRYLADHVIVGTGMNLLAPALAILIYLSTVAPNGIENIQMAGEFNHWMIFYDASTSLNKLAIWMAGSAVLIALGSAWYLNETKGGLRIRTSGENPYSLETAGISVSKTRRKALLIAGALSGLAGSIFLIMTPTFGFTVTGSGFLAIAILIMAGHKVSGTMFYSAILAVFMTVFNSWLKLVPGSVIPADVMMTLPFIFPIIGLIIFRNRSIPSAVGKPFSKNQR